MGASLSRVLSPTNRSKHEWAILCLLVFASLFIHFRYLLQIEHNVDHAYYIGQALRTIEQGSFPIIGQATSLQIPNSAALGYLYIPILLIARHVLVVYVLVLALNSIAVVFIYRLGRGMSGVFAGLVASILYVGSAWMIEYTRSTWSYSIMPFLLCVLAYAVYRALFGSDTGRNRTYGVAMVCTTLITLITLTGYFILPTLLLILIVFRRLVHWRLMLKWSPVFIVPTLIFGIALAAQWQITSGQSQTVLAASQGATVRSEPVLHALRLVTGADYELLRGLEAPIQDWNLRHTLSIVANVFSGILIVIGVWLTFWQIWRRKPRHLFLLIWWLTPILLMSYNSALIHPFYLLVSMPMGFLLAGVGASVLAGKRVWSQSLVIFGLIGMLVIGWINSSRYYEETAALPGTHGLTALSLEYALPLGNAIKANLRDGTVVFSSVEGWILHSFAGTTFDVNRIENNIQRMIVPIAHGLLVSLGQTSGVSLVNTTTIYERKLPDNTQLLIQQVDNKSWMPNDFVSFVIEGEQLTLLGYRLRGEGISRHLDVYWQVNAVPIDTTALYSLSVHGYAGDERLFIADGKPIAMYKWHIGDVLAQTVSFEILDEQAVSLRVGLFDGARGLSIPFAGENTTDGMIVLPD